MIYYIILYIILYYIIYFIILYYIILYYIILYYVIYYIYQQSFPHWRIGCNPSLAKNLLIHPSPGTISSPTKG